MSGDSEGTPVAIMEAMAAGLPVITIRHAGIPEVMKHQAHGLLGDPMDIKTMSAYMDRLTGDPQLQQPWRVMQLNTPVVHFRCTNRSPCYRTFHRIQ